MSGDVQPRKRKDKKKRKDEALPVEEPYRGTTATFGEGDVFLHTHSEHGTGGHWCAKVVFFSLLAVLITLIGLIILENRGLSDLEASAVQSQYSGVLEGWIEDAPDDDHHDEHTLDLKHHDDDEEDQQLELDDDDHEVDEDDEEHGNGGHDDDEVSEENDTDDDDDEQSQEDLDEEEDQSQEDLDNEDQVYENYNDNEIDEQDDDDDNEQDEDDDNEQEEDYSKQQDSAENDEQDSAGNYDDDDEENISQLDNENEDEQSVEDQDSDETKVSQETEDKEDDHGDDDDDEHDDDDDDDEDDEKTELEHIEEEPTDVEPISVELPALPEPDDDDDDNKAEEETSIEDQSPDDDDDDDDEFLEHDNLEEDAPVVERITAPQGKPFKEFEEEDSTEEPPVDTLAEEEEYERRQEELRREEEMASHMWLKVGVGAALLLATHAVVRRAVAPRDEPEDQNGEDETVREETPTPDRRMTLVPEQAAPPAPKPVVKEPPITKRDEGTVTRIPLVIKSAPTPKELSFEDEDANEPEEEELEEEVEDAPKRAEEKNKELYSDDEEEIEEEVEEEEEEEVIIPKQEAPKLIAPLQKPSAAPLKPPTPEPSPEPDEDVPDDVEIIEEEELEEDDDEEEISDVDDVELLSRLEAKYGRLPEPERPGQKHKDGGDSLDDEWPGEPADSFWRERLDSSERELRQGSWTAAVELASATQLSSSARARWIIAKTYDEMAEAKRDNKLLSRSITAYLELLKMNEKLSDKRLLEITNRTLNRIQFRGVYLNAEPVHRLLIRRFPDNPGYRNNLTISYLMANRNDLAAESLKETLKLWPNDRVALAHYGFILKIHYNKNEDAVEMLQKALEGDIGPANEPRFYYHLGDALLLLGRYSEAHKVHKRGAKLGHFLSPAQRSLYNVERLKSQAWWNVDQTPYTRMARALEKSWKEILQEGEAARTLYVAEKEGLREKGEWSQMDLFIRGREVPDRCKRAPVTCSIVKSEAAAVGCRRGQIKFSLMEPGTHVRPHVGPTNCRLRMHLALSNTKDTYLRVDKETRQWQVGKVLMFDDSFEHEVWHNGTGSRLVLIVDVWHPDLTAHERRTLPSI